MKPYIVDIGKIDSTKLEIAGGKGANIGELLRIDGVRTPKGFCVTTNAYNAIIQQSDDVATLLDRLTKIKADDQKGISDISQKIRTAIEASPIMEPIAEEISSYLPKYGKKSAFAVRSSATAEDLPAASFAGLHDTYLNIIGTQEILVHISKCWASLFTDRAVSYRIRQGIDHRQVALSVLVQKMILPQTAGTLFTADPVTNNRKILSIEASFGLGEALVSGIVNPDIYKVRNGSVVDKRISLKKTAIYARDGGGTKSKEIMAEWQNRQVLTDGQMIALEEIGRKIEAHFGRPQDIEWCIADGTAYILQSRPITTLFPIPNAKDDQNHVYVSVGHQQMMTDPMKPLGLSTFQVMAAATMYEAGGRLFVDVSNQLASPAGREAILKLTGQHDPLIKDALLKVIARENFIRPIQENKTAPTAGSDRNNTSLHTPQLPIENDPAVISELMEKSETSLKALKKSIQTKSGPDLFEFILQDIQQFKKEVFSPQSIGIIMAAMNASAWINEKTREWLNEKNAADILSQSLPHNVTSEMGLALLDIADVIRPFPEVIAFIKDEKADPFGDQLENYQGGSEVRIAIDAFLDRYGMRCPGEIDLTRPRWSERPAALVPILLGNIRNCPPGAGRQRFEQGRQDAFKKEKEILDRLAALPDGEQKAVETKQKIDLLRNFSGYREYPKYSIISRFFVYKQALIKEAATLFQANMIDNLQDIYYLTFEDFHEVARTRRLDHRIIEKRKTDYKVYEKLPPPRVITSEGEIVSGEYKRENIPAGALIGLPVSTGVVEGRARILFHIEEADLKEGDILITPYTDPSWTPLFLSIKGLVTEVGGLMTHGAVIAREYGLPAIVGMKGATTLIKDGQKVRVNGTNGYLEIL